MVSTIISEEGCNLFVNLQKTVCTVLLPPGWVTSLYKLYRYVTPHQAGFFAYFGLESGVVFEGTTGMHEHIYCVNSK